MLLYLFFLSAPARPRDLSNTWGFPKIGGKFLGAA